MPRPPRAAKRGDRNRPASAGSSRTPGKPAQRRSDDRRSSSPGKHRGAPKKQPLAAAPGKPRGTSKKQTLAAAEKASRWVPSKNARLIGVEAGMDLAHFLVHYTKKALSVRAARRQLANGCCRIDGRVETYGSRILKRDEVVEFFLPETTEHQFDRKRLLLDDVGVIAYDKPAFLPVTPTDAIKSWSLLDVLQGELGELIPVHRLDADTSGIVLFARSQQIAERLEQLFRDHAVEKTYHAIVRGHPRETGQYRSYLVKKKSQPGLEVWGSGRGPEAREAITNWTLEKRLGAYGSLVRVEPKTGRYHQIRIHFSEMGFPLYGDRVYGDRRDPIHVTRHLLHASRIKLPHPVGGSAIDVQCRLPKDFTTAMDALRKL